MIADTGLITIPLPEQLILKKGTTLRQYVDNKKGYFFCKRLLDIVIAVLVIVIVLSWLLPLLAFLIKLTSGGPVFFLQKRVGRGGKTFICYKLRTMVTNDMAHMYHGGNHNERITRLGHFLRKSNLDELPQFFNVLLGSMSIAGPRPHMHADCLAFSQLIPGYKFRNLVKPGITGLAQIKGYHGKVISRDCIIKRYQWDAWYVRNAGFWLDMRIIVTTAIQRIHYIIINSPKVRKTESRKENC